jgi:hypothetical protein
MTTPAPSLTVSLSVALTSMLALPITGMMLTHEALPGLSLVEVMQDGGWGMWLIVALAGVAMTISAIALFFGVSRSNLGASVPFLAAAPAAITGVLSMSAALQQARAAIAFAAPVDRTVITIAALSEAGWASVLGLLVVCGSLTASAVAFALASSLRPSPERLRYGISTVLAAVVGLFAWAQAHRLALLLHTLHGLIAREDAPVAITDPQPLVRLMLAGGLALCLSAVAVSVRRGATSVMGPILATVALVSVGGVSALSHASVNLVLDSCRASGLPAFVELSGEDLHTTPTQYLGTAGLTDEAGQPVTAGDATKHLWVLGLTSPTAPLRPQLAPAFAAGVRQFALMGQAPTPARELPAELAPLALRLNRELRGVMIFLAEESPGTPTARLDATGLQLDGEHWDFSAPSPNNAATDDSPLLVLELGADTPALLVARAAVTATAHARQPVIVVGHRAPDGAPASP